MTPGSCFCETSTNLGWFPIFLAYLGHLEVLIDSYFSHLQNDGFACKNKINKFANILILCCGNGTT